MIPSDLNLSTCPIIVLLSLEQRCSIIHRIVELLSDKLTELLYYLDKLYFSL